MNNKKMVFIIAVNNELYYEECKWYIDRLTIPKDFEIDILAIYEASSMTEAYNAAMYSSDAKYKVYLHQDVFIINKNFIVDIIKVFELDEELGMLGVIGGNYLPESGVMYDAWNCGRTVTCDYSLSVDATYFQKKPYTRVDAIDGMLMVTQYDIPWREDILKQWHYYDISQSFEFIRAGYKLCIPYQDRPWSIHDSGTNDLTQYDNNRRIMFDEYTEFFKGKVEDYPFDYNYELQELSKYIYMQVKSLVNNGTYEEASQILNEVKDNGMSKNLPLLKHLLSIYQLEKSNSNIEKTIFDKGFNVDELLYRYMVIKFYLRRLEYIDHIEPQKVYQWIIDNNVSSADILVITIHNSLNRLKSLDIVKEAYSIAYDSINKNIIELIISKIRNNGLTMADIDNIALEKRQRSGEFFDNKSR